MRRFFNYVPSDEALRRGKWTVIVLFVAVLLVAVWAVLWLAHENDILDERDRQSLSDREDLRRDLTAEQLAREALEQQIRGLGERPVVEPEDVPDDAQVVVVPGPKGDKGDRGDSCIEALGFNRCRGDQGQGGEDGSDGSDGQDGADSNVPGPVGPKGDLGPKGDKGDKGDAGERGPAGADGRGIQSVTCEGGQFVVTYTDGTSHPVAGSSCVAAPGNSGETP